MAEDFIYSKVVPGLVLAIELSQIQASCSQTGTQRRELPPASLMPSNMRPILSQWTVLIALSPNIGTRVVAQTTSFSPFCVPGSQVTAFPACNNMLGFFDNCPNLPSKQQERSCFCVQDSLDSLFEYSSLPGTHSP